MSSVFDYTVPSPDGQDVALASYAGHVLLIVNTASRCGFTPQYAGLQALQRRFGERGFCVLGFPCNQFGAQEPGDAADIAQICTSRYDVTFPVMAKIEVNGPNALPLYRYLKSARRGLFGTQTIKWNFTKFLVGRDGRPLRRFAPATKPDKLVRAIEDALAS